MWNINKFSNLNKAGIQDLKSIIWANTSKKGQNKPHAHWSVSNKLDNVSTKFGLYVPKTDYILH